MESETQNISRKLFKGTLWLALSRVALNGLSTLSTIVLARLLLPSDFGLVAIAYSILTIVASLSELSLKSALIQREELADEHFDSVWTIGLIRGVLTTAVLVAMAWPVSKFYGEPRLPMVLVVIGLAAGLSSLTSPRTILLNRKLVFWHEFVVQATQKGVGFVATVGSAFLLHNYWAIVIGHMFGVLATLAASYVIAPYRPRIRLSHLGDLLSFSMWLAFCNLLYNLNMRLEQLALGYLGGKVELGNYAMADNIAAMPVREGTTPINATLFPAFSRINADGERLKHAFLRAQTALALVALPIGFGFALVADRVVPLLLGNRWLATIPIMQLLSCAFAIAILGNGLNPLAMAMNRNRMLFFRDLVGVAIHIPSILIGYRYGGVIGVALARALTAPISTLRAMYSVRQISHIPMREQLDAVAKPLLATMVMAGAVLSLARVLPVDTRPIGLLLAILAQVSAGGVAYTATLFAAWLATGRKQGVELEICRTLLGMARR